MNQKISIILIVIVVLSIGGFFAYKNIFVLGGKALLRNIPDTPINEICLKISQIEDVFSCLAVANANDDFCQEIKSAEEKNLCFALANKNISFCRKIESQEAREICYYELSFMVREINYCDELDNWEQCYFSFIHRLHWQGRSDEIKAEYCEKFSEEAGLDLAFKDSCRAFKEHDSSFCQDNEHCLSFFPQPLSFCDDNKMKEKNDCLRDRALTAKDASICEKITDTYIRNRCYGSYSAHISPDLSLCDKISDKMIKNMCYRGYAIHLARREPIIQGEPAEKTGKTVDEKEEVIEKEPKPEEEQPKIPASYHIENPPYYREDGFCWGAGAIMLMMAEGFSGDEIQTFRTIAKSGPGGPPDMFRGFVDFGLINRIRIAYSKDYNKQFADFYNQQILVRPEEQVMLLNSQTDALNKLKELISSDVLVMIIGHHGNHYMIVTGYDENCIYISDPGIDEVFLQKVDYQSKYQEKTKMSVKNFFEQWNISDFEGGGIGFPGDYGMIWLEK